MQPTRILTSFVLITVLIGLITGCTQTASGSNTAAAQARDGDLPAGVVFQVIGTDGAVTDFTPDDLKHLDLITIMVEGKPEEGPALQAVLSQAGIEVYAEVILTGADGALTLSKDQVQPEVILDLTNRGTVKFASADLPKDQWLHDITKIEVR